MAAMARRYENGVSFVASLLLRSCAVCKRPYGRPAKQSKLPAEFRDSSQAWASQIQVEANALRDKMRALSLRNSTLSYSSRAL